MDTVSASTSSDSRRATLEHLFGIVDRIRAHFDTVATQAGLSPAQATALLQLDDPIPMHQLASALSCDRSNVTGIVDRLEDQGLVERQGDVDDRRVKNLVLTPTGVQLRARIQQQLFSELPEAAGLSPTQLEDLGRLLGQQSNIAT